MSTALDSAAALPRIAPPDARPIRMALAAEEAGTGWIDRCRLRRAIRLAIDAICRDDPEMTRREVTAWLAGAMGMGEFRIGLMNIKECERALAILKPEVER